MYNFEFIADNKEIPSDLRKDAIDIQKTLDWEGPGGEG